MAARHIDRIRCVQLVLTPQCNLRCAYCFQNAKRRGRMDARVLRRAVDLLVESRGQRGELAFYGGEPLLEFSRMREAVRYAERARSSGKEIRFSISTNGTMLDERVAAFLSEHRVRTQISFDGVPAAQRLRGEGTFDPLDRLLDRLARRLPRFFREDVAVAITPMVRTLPHLARSVRYFLEKGVATIHMAPTTTHDPDWAPRTRREMERQFTQVHEACARHVRREGEIPVSLLRRTRVAPGRAPRQAAVCDGATGERLAVDVDGQVYGCAAFAESYQIFPAGLLHDSLRAMRLGDLNDRAFRRRLAKYPDAARGTRIFHSKERKHSFHGRCGDCRFVDSCRICPLGTGFIPGNRDPHRIPDFSCAFHRAALEVREELPCAPDTEDVLTGRALVPEKLREFDEWLVASRRGRVAEIHRGGSRRSGSSTSARASRTPTSGCQSGSSRPPR